mmetsp:Transcript_20632/g.38506  ORF Transcript_20632/g.38506 Transcript_20632/m.38506 type:complete len:405 (+) Transcript_20632:766-1980(+)
MVEAAESAVGVVGRLGPRVVRAGGTGSRQGRGLGAVVTLRAHVSLVQNGVGGKFFPGPTSADVSRRTRIADLPLRVGSVRSRGAHGAAVFHHDAGAIVVEDAVVAQGAGVRLVTHERTEHSDGAPDGHRRVQRAEETGWTGLREGRLPGAVVRGRAHVRKGGTFVAELSRLAHSRLNGVIAAVGAPRARVAVGNVPAAVCVSVGARRAGKGGKNLLRAVRAGRARKLSHVRNCRLVAQPSGGAREAGRLVLLSGVRVVSSHRAHHRLRHCHTVVARVTGNRDGVAGVANEASRAASAVVRGHAVGFSPDGLVLARGGVNGAISAVVPWRTLTAVLGHPVPVNIVELSRAGVEKRRGTRHARSTKVRSRALAGDPTIQAVVSSDARKALARVCDVDAGVVSSGGA